MEMLSRRIDGTGPVVNLSLEAGFEDVIEFTISPDSKRVVYTGDPVDEGVVKLYARAIDGSDTYTRLSKAGDGDIPMFVVLTNNQVLYFADDDKVGTYELWLRPIKGSDLPTKLNGPLVDGGDIEYAKLSQDFHWVVYEADAERHNVFELYSVRLVDAAPGELKWQFFSGAMRSTPAIGADGMMYFGSYDGLHAADWKTGAEKWKFETDGGVESSPALADGTVYFGAEDYHVYAVDGTSGTLKWEFATGSSVSSSPAIGFDGTVYVGSDGGRVYALDGQTGDKKWELNMGHAVNSSPALGVDGTVYVGALNGRFLALDGASGDKVGVRLGNLWLFLAGYRARWDGICGGIRRTSLRIRWSHRSQKVGVYPLGPDLLFSRSGHGWNCVYWFKRPQALCPGRRHRKEKVAF
jgi:outer membrane protein assembly factor BamB